MREMNSNGLTVGDPKSIMGNCDVLIFIELILNASYVT